MAAGTKARADDITVVIATIGRTMLLDTLRLIAEGDVLPDRVVVADQGGTLPFDAWAGELGAHGLVLDVYRNRATGKSAALNAGIRHVRTPFIAITDDDCLPAPDWIAAMVARLRADPSTVVSGRVVARGERPNVALAPSDTERRVTRPALTFDPMSGGNFGFAVETFRKVGPFDEHPSVRAAEDTDWAYRALRAGAPIVHAPEVVAEHSSWRDEGERRDTYRAYALCHGGFYGKHIGRGDGFMALRAAINTARAARRWLRGVIRGDREARMHGAAYVRYLLPGIIAGLRRESDGA